MEARTAALTATQATVAEREAAHTSLQQHCKDLHVCHICSAAASCQDWGAFLCDETSRSRAPHNCEMLDMRNGRVDCSCRKLYTSCFMFPLLQVAAVSYAHLQDRLRVELEGTTKRSAEEVAELESRLEQAAQDLAASNAAAAAAAEKAATEMRDMQVS